MIMGLTGLMNLLDLLALIDGISVIGISYVLKKIAFMTAEEDKDHEDGMLGGKPIVPVDPADPPVTADAGGFV